MATQAGPTGSGGRRKYTAEFKKEAVQMMLDGHSAVSIAKKLGMKNVNLLYPWKAAALRRSGSEAQILDGQVSELRNGLIRTCRERDIFPLDRSTSVDHVSRQSLRFLGVTVRGVRRSWLICRA